jgi:hypothetical protein
MSIKAINGRSVGGDIKIDEKSKKTDIENHNIDKKRRDIYDNNDANIDEIIMVMMPRVTWDAIGKLASDNNATIPETINTALKLLEKMMEDKKEK